MSLDVELVSIVVILVFCSILLVLLDAAVSGILSLTLGILFRTAFRWGLLSLMVPPLAMAYGGLVERNLAKVHRVELSFAGLPEAFDGYRIVQISDIHLRSFIGRERVLGKMVEKIDGLDPDLIAFTGDVITLDSGELRKTSSVLSGLKARDGVVSVLGNHDYGLYMDESQAPTSKAECAADVVRLEREMGWKVLLDESLVLSKGTVSSEAADSIAIVGVEYTSPSPHFRSCGNLGKAAAGTEGMFRILLSHDPMHWDMEVVGQDYPLTLSGHTHSSQFSLLGWSPSRYMFKRYRGPYEAGEQVLYVNVGLGETLFPVRIGTRPEITLITLRRK